MRVCLRTGPAQPQEKAERQPSPSELQQLVDAALDLNHTQNIGRMIKAHFPHSQFIVVSLKEGMFSNANVIYRTRFIEGVSTVTRTVPEGSGAAEGVSKGKGGKGKAAAVDAAGLKENTRPAGRARTPPGPRPARASPAGVGFKRFSKSRSASSGPTTWRTTC